MASRLGNKLKVFDWARAAEILRERGLPDAEAGLQNDMEWTGGSIMRDHKPVPREETYTFLASIWATPILVINDEEISCWKYDDNSHNTAAAETYWPDYAVQALTRGDA